jgi:hypothetical protein
MAKGRKTGGRDWKKGQSGNLKGGPGLPGDLRNARKFNLVELERAINRLIYLSPDQAELLLTEEPSYLYRIVYQILDKAAEYGDQNRLEWICTRLIGKVKDQIEVSTPKPFVIHRPSDGSAVELGATIETEKGSA